MKLTTENPIIITVIYPDGVIETINKDDRTYHMEYMKTLIDSSKRLRDLIESKHLYLPSDIEEIRYMLSYELCTKLTEDGLLIINNLCIDKPYMEEDEDFQEYYNVYLPSELTDKQKLLLLDLMNNNDMSDSTYGQLINGEMTDLEYNEVRKSIEGKVK